MKKLFMVAFFISTLAQAEHAVSYFEAIDGVEYFWSVDLLSPKLAEKTVLEKCKNSLKKSGDKDPCKILISGKGPVYIAFFHATNGAVGVRAHIDKQRAIDLAYIECAKLGNCPHTPEKLIYDKGPVLSASSGQPEKQCSPPAGGKIYYRDSCTNGDCFRTYENGCTVRFQAKQCFNSSTNQWEWKPDGC